MTKAKSTKRALLASILSMMLCMAMLIGSTFAWFTDSVTSGKNKIVAGNLDIELNYWDGTQWANAENVALFDYDKWEPGYMAVQGLQVKNAGNLALKWKAAINSTKELSILGDVIDVYVKSGADYTYAKPATREEVTSSWTNAGTLNEFVAGIETTTYGSLEAGDTADLGLALVMRTSAGNEYQGVDLGGDITLTILATQDTVESDSFDDQYDKDAQYAWDGFSVKPVTPDTEGNYNVSNGAELAWIAQQVNNNDAETDKMTIVLQSDIDLNGKEWTPIGGENVFSGTFDGNGHTIKNLKASKCDNPGYEDRSIGLIGYAADVTVKNLKIENCEVSGRYAAGAVVGEADGPILFENIEVLSGNITADQNSEGKTAQVAGGILGIGYGAGTDYDGSIVFRNCVNYSNITVNKQHAGGLWGSITYANNADVIVDSCHNYGNITSLSQDNGGYAGGFGGYFAAKSLTITNSTNMGTIKADKYQGNFVGYSVLTKDSVNE